MNNHLVSVVTPCYNASSFIGESIRSVLSQTYSNWEMLIVDDCSTDNSAGIVREYASQDSRIKYFSTEKASGSPVRPRNIGVANAKGRYIAFLDSDDVWLPSKLERQLPLFEDPSVALAYSYYEKMTEKGERNNRVVYAPNEVTYNRLLLGNVIGCLTAVYDVAKLGKMYFPNHSHEDYILWLSILKQGGIARNTNTVEALYRVREKSISSDKKQAMSWQWDIYRNVEGFGVLRSAYYFLNYAYKAFRKAQV